MLSLQIKNKIAILDNRTPLLTIMDKSESIKLFNKIPTVEKLMDVHSIYILAESKIDTDYRTDLNGLKYLREIRFWNKIKSPIILISFFSNSYIINDPERRRLFSLADKFIRLPFNEDDIETVININDDEVNKKNKDFMIGKRKEELFELLGTTNHPSAFFRDLKYLHSTDYLNTSNKLLTLIELLENIISKKTNSKLIKQIKNIESYFSNKNYQIPENDILISWIENDLWRK